jgi:hypothetical protein
LKLHLRAIGDTADIDQLTAALAASGLRITRICRGLPAREADSERAYIDLEQATRTESTEAAA